MRQLYLIVHKFFYLEIEKVRMRLLYVIVHKFFFSEMKINDYIKGHNKIMQPILGTKRWKKLFQTETETFANRNNLISSK